MTEVITKKMEDFDLKQYTLQNVSDNHTIGQ